MICFNFIIDFFLLILESGKNNILLSLSAAFYVFFMSIMAFYLCFIISYMNEWHIMNI